MSRGMIVQGGQMSRGKIFPGGHMSGGHLSEGLMSRRIFVQGTHYTALFYLSEETFDNQFLSLYQNSWNYDDINDQL